MPCTTKWTFVLFGSENSCALLSFAKGHGHLPQVIPLHLQSEACSGLKASLDTSGAHMSRAFIPVKLTYQEALHDVSAMQQGMPTMPR